MWVVGAKNRFVLLICAGLPAVSLQPESVGFVAIINPLRVHEVATRDLANALAPDQYAAHVAQREGLRTIT